RVALVVLLELEGGGPEGVGLHDVGACGEIPLMDAAHHVGVGIVPQLRAVAFAQPRFEEHGAVSAVEEEDLTPANALDDLPARRGHAAAGTPIKALALMTARVESFA